MLGSQRCRFKPSWHELGPRMWVSFLGKCPNHLTIEANIVGPTSLPTLASHGILTAYIFRNETPVHICNKHVHVAACVWPMYSLLHIYKSYIHCVSVVQRKQSCYLHTRHFDIQNTNNWIHKGNPILNLLRTKIKNLQAITLQVDI